ncbi:MAG: hypothetical protein ACLQU4_06625 [Limisphaerales bacterium]
MKTALLLLFAAETILYSLFWHNQPARSEEPKQPARPKSRRLPLERKPARAGGKPFMVSSTG